MSSAISRSISQAVFRAHQGKSDAHSHRKKCSFQMLIKACCHHAKEPVCTRLNTRVNVKTPERYLTRTLNLRSSPSRRCMEYPKSICNPKRTVRPLSDVPLSCNTMLSGPKGQTGAVQLMLLEHEGTPLFDPDEN